MSDESDRESETEGVARPVAPGRAGRRRAGSGKQDLIATQLRRVYDAPALLGFLARAAGLRERTEPVTPAELLRGFEWARVRREDCVVRWTGSRLDLGETPRG